jgi:hypothetical protein
MSTSRDRVYVERASAIERGARRRTSESKATFTLRSFARNERGDLRSQRHSRYHARRVYWLVSRQRWLEFNYAMAFLTLRLPRLLNYYFMGAQSEERSDA